MILPPRLQIRWDQTATDTRLIRMLCFTLSLRHARQHEYFHLFGIVEVSHTRNDHAVVLDQVEPLRFCRQFRYLHVAQVS